MPRLENRIPPPIVAIAVAIAMAGASYLAPRLGASASLRFGLAAVFLIASGLLVAAAVSAMRRAQTTVDPIHIDRASSLVTTGVFGRTRNPMYLSLASLLTGLAFYLDAPACLIGTVVFVLYITRFQIFPEERALEAKFGAAYLDYKRRVRRWL